MNGAEVLQGAEFLKGAGKEKGAARAKCKGSVKGSEYKIMDAVDFIEQYLCEPFEREDIAHAAGLSLRQLYRLFKLHTGDALVNYVS